MPRKRDPNKPIGPTPLVLEGDAKRAAQDHICEQIAEGRGLRTICREDVNAGLPAYRTVYDWMAADKEFSDRMEVARQIGADVIAEETLEIADDARNDWMERHDPDGDDTGWKLNGEHVQRSKLRIDTRLKLLAKWHPKKYGEKVTAEHTGPGGGPVQYERIERVIVDPTKPE